MLCYKFSVKSSCSYIILKKCATNEFSVQLKKAHFLVFFSRKTCSTLLVLMTKLLDLQKPIRNRWKNNDHIFNLSYYSAIVSLIINLSSPLEKVDSNCQPSKMSFLSRVIKLSLKEGIVECVFEKC